MAAVNRPYRLTPAAKDYLWGGSRLNDDFNLNVPISPFAEAWVFSAHPDGQSRIEELDCTLEEALRANPDWLGEHARALNHGQVPILMKLIDARQDLSVQVHPDDAYASAHEGTLGKTEMWYVLDARPDAKLIYGFNQDVTPRQVAKAAENGRIELLLNHLPVHRGDLFYIEAGTVHAIGAGCLIAEIQESSNITYRLYDYGRVDRNGAQRPLHLDKALQVMRMESSTVPRQPMRVLRYKSGTASELLTRCKYFQVERMLLNTEVQRDLATFQTGSNSFHALLCIDGCGSISGEAVHLNFFKGDCLFIPANSVPLKLHGKAQLLNVSC